jgi:hypothetical protein
MPDSRAIWRELTHLDPETYDLQNKRKAPIHQPLAPPQHARPRDLEPMFISMVRRLKAIGVLEDPVETLTPTIETTATPVDPTTES